MEICAGRDGGWLALGSKKIRLNTGIVPCTWVNPKLCGFVVGDKPDICRKIVNPAQALQVQAAASNISTPAVFLRFPSQQQ